jgi:hypothetical protein
MGVNKFLKLKVLNNAFKNKINKKLKSFKSNEVILKDQSNTNNEDK